jgi:hypothetical protein
VPAAVAPVPRENFEKSSHRRPGWSTLRRETTMKFYSLSLSYSGVAFEVFVNGFPVWETENTEGGGGGCSLNMQLIGMGNKLHVKAGKREADAYIRGSVRAASEGDMISTDDAPQFELGAGDTIDYTFDSDIAPFADLLAKLQPATDAQARDAATKLRDLLKAGKLKEALPAFRPKIELYAAANGAPADAMLSEFSGMLGQLKHAVDVGDGELMTRAYCDGRIHEVRRDSGKAFFHMKEDGGELSMPLFIGLIDGQPAVVV